MAQLHPTSSSFPRAPLVIHLHSHIPQHTVPWLQCLCLLPNLFTYTFCLSYDAVLLEGQHQVSFSSGSLTG